MTIRWTGLAAGTLLALFALTPAQAAPARRGRSTTLNSYDRHFLEHAIQDSQAEIVLGHLVLKKSDNRQVKDFAQKMINDHSRASGKLVRIAGRTHTVPPKHLDDTSLSAYKHLETLSGAAFDQEYMKHMVSDHSKDVRQMPEFIAKISNPEVKAEARLLQPVLQQHLALAEKVRSSLKGNGDRNDEDNGKRT